jgi:hypothetical protein
MKTFTSDITKPVKSALGRMVLIFSLLFIKKAQKKTFTIG